MACFNFKMPLTVTISVLLLCGLKGVSSIIHSGRLQLMRDALDWMTIRKEGKLVSSTELEKLFLPHLTDRYSNDHFYRAFVIAFLEGVVPRLTIPRSRHCDPTYTLKYKDPWNSSVTYGHQSIFNFDTFDERKTSYVQFCDYRQGLICNTSTKICDCPAGSTMQPIESGSSVRRCLLNENETCALIDLSHGSDPTQPELARNLPHLAFNLEKPLSCKMGTQCRFKPTDLVSPHCYPVNGGPWAPPFNDTSGNSLSELVINFGEECTLGLYAGSGMCGKPLLDFSASGEFICYNYGPPRSIRSSNSPNKTGFCGPSLGRFGIGSSNMLSNYRFYQPNFTPYIHPRTVPLRGKELEDFITKYWDEAVKLGPNQIVYDILTHTKGGACSIQKTKDFEDVWRYFSSLDDDPPAGQDYVPAATKSELDANLQKFVDLTNLTISPGKICKVYYNIDRNKILGGEHPEVHHPSLKCVPGTRDDSGNDGTCEEPGTFDTFPYAQKFLQFLDDEATERSFSDEFKSRWRPDIIRAFPEFPETQCTSENYTCPEGYACFDDYNDDVRGLYNDSTCEFKLDTPPLELFCHKSRKDLKYDKCETMQLDKRGLEEFEKLANYSTLGRGATCQYELELKIRHWIHPPSDKPQMYNKYALLALLRGKEYDGFIRSFLCDRSKLLECSEAGVCECYKWKENDIFQPVFQPRKVIFEGTKYESDYCYQASGRCTKMEEFEAFTAAEMEKIRMHYGDPNSLCDGGNLCAYISGSFCTEENTGEIGYEGFKLTTSTSRSTTRKIGGGGGRRPGPETWDASGNGYRASENLRGTWVIVGWSLVIQMRLQVGVEVTNI